MLGSAWIVSGARTSRFRAQRIVGDRALGEYGNRVSAEGLCHRRGTSCRPSRSGARCGPRPAGGYRGAEQRGGAGDGACRTRGPARRDRLLRGAVGVLGPSRRRGRAGLSSCRALPHLDPVLWLRDGVLLAAAGRSLGSSRWALSTARRRRPTRARSPGQAGSCWSREAGQYSRHHPANSSCLRSANQSMAGPSASRGAQPTHR